MKCLFSLLLFASLASAETNISYQVGDYSQFGYKGVFSVVRVEPSYKWLRGQFEYSPTNKYNGSGWSYRAGIAAFDYSAKVLAIGAGIDLSETRTDEWSKRVVRPYIEIQARTKPVRFFGRYRFAGYDPHNGLRGIEGGIYAYPAKHIGFTFEVKRANYRMTDTQEKRTGIAYQMGPLIRF